MPEDIGKPIKKYDVFISYAREDTEIMHEVYKSLKSAGLSVWADIDGIKRGDRWRKEIENAIEKSRSMVILLSPDAKKSSYVNKEIAYAKTHELRLFPLRVRGSEKDSIPFELIDLDWATIINLVHIG